MKKAISLFAACLLLVGMMAVSGFSVSAATPKEDIVAAVKEAMPDKYEERYLPMVENVLSQIEVTAEQAEEVIGYIDAAKAAIKEDKGASLSEYSSEEVNAVLDNFGAACTTLGLTYELKDAEDPNHKGDIDCIVYLADGTKVGAVDGDGVKKTDVAETNVALFVALGALALAAAGAAVYGKKLAAAR